VKASVIGLGQPFAADDGVGVRIIQQLLAAPPADAELLIARDAMELVELTLERDLVILVDALLGGGPLGSIHELEPEQLDGSSLVSFSSHGTSVGQALALARRLHPGEISPDIRIIGVSIASLAPSEGLSPEVEAAVPKAVDRIRSILTDTRPRRR
jgi:hydrogenase maturation protease